MNQKTWATRSTSSSVSGRNVSLRSPLSLPTVFSFRWSCDRPSRGWSACQSSKPAARRIRPVPRSRHRCSAAGISDRTGHHRPLSHLLHRGRARTLAPSMRRLFRPELRPGLRRDVPASRELKELRRLGLHALYYVSHAPFLFIAPDAGTLNSIRDLLIHSGLPASRLEHLEDHDASAQDRQSTHPGSYVAWRS